MFPDRFNLATYLLDHNIEAGRGGKVALRWRDEQHTYEALVRDSGRLAQALVELGLRMEERVLLALSDGPEFSHAFFAILKAGGVFVNVNPLLKRADFEYYLEYSRARIAIIDPSLAPAFASFAPHSPHLHAVVVADREGDQVLAGQHSLRQLIGQAPRAMEAADTHKHDVAGWLFTSGSTGRPKGAVHFHEDYAFNVEMYAKQVLGIDETDVTAGVPKLFFGYATGTNLMFPFAVGATTALFSGRSTPEKMFEVVEKYRPTILTNVPTMIGKMLALEAQGGARDLSSLRLVLSAGEKLPDALQRQWLDRCGVEILDGIGSAELFHIHISNRPGAVRPGSLGQPVPGYDCRVVDDTGFELPAGETGRLHVRGESAALCYWQAHEASKETFRGDLVITGDLFRMDEDGYFYYEGRADSLLKVGGKWVAPHEVEECLLSHAGVEQAAVVGWEDAEGLVKPRAFVVPGAGQTGDEPFAAALQEWVRTKLAPHKYPRVVTFMDDLPKNDRGKLDRRSLTTVDD